ncbi:MAG: hypothetical protein CMJ46_02570 [Planctomyces sp.]|nr:hypothetical protein [Planctomyces sp.]
MVIGGGQLHRFLIDSPDPEQGDKFVHEVPTRSALTREAGMIIGCFEQTISRVPFFTTKGGER